MKNIEVEVRALISKDDFLRLKRFFGKKAKFLNHHRDETVYFDSDGRTRLRLEKNRSYFVHKSGRIHDRHREELEINLKKFDFLPAQKFMEFLGKPVVVRWIRERFVWKFNGLKVYLDNSKGYGRIFEIEAVVYPRDKEKSYQKMLEIFKSLNIKPTPREKIQKHYKHYLKNWQRLI